MDSYKYTPLNTSAAEIRLLTLLPGNMGTDIYVELNSVILTKESCPSYEALSYCWGPKTDPGLVYIRNGNENSTGGPVDVATLSITCSLAEALQHLRYPDQTRAIWIDAICVNQKDLEERGQQVPRMVDVYTSAECVIVWLGPEADDSSLAFKTLDHIGSMIEVDWLTWLLKPSDKAKELKETYWSEIGKHFPLKEDAVAQIYSIYKKPWFERLWIRQEIRLATKAIVVCGFDSMPWPAFQKAVFYLNNHWNGMYSRIKPDGRDDYTKRKDLIWRLCSPGTYKNFMQHLNDAKECKCADPRDRVFAFLSIPSLVTNSVKVVPNYESSVDEAYKEFFLQYVKSYQSSYLSLEIISSAEMHDDTTTWPSWVPDWEVGRSTQLLDDTRACGFSFSQVKYIGNDILRTSGIKVDTVSKAIFTGITEKSATEIEFLAAIQQLTSQLGGTADEEWLDSFSRTLNGNRFSDDYDPQMRNARPDLDVCKELYRLVFTLSSVDDLPRPLEARFALVITTSYRYMDQRSFLSTKQGRMGLGPRLSKAGDEIVVFPGCGSPMVLRPLPNGRYKVVGECFILNLMHGEAFLGPLPDDYKAIRKLDRTAGRWGPVYRDMRTGIDHPIDPRFDLLRHKERDGMRRLYIDGSEDKEASGVLMKTSHTYGTERVEVMLPGLRDFDLE